MSDREDFETRIFSYYPPLQRVREFVERNLSEPISLREAAGAAGLEEKYFSAFFHRKTGVLFRDWLAGRRVERAIEILTRHDDTITSVAANAGFQDLRTFERSFKRITGVTPREFKRSVAPEFAAQAAMSAVAATAMPLPVADLDETRSGQDTPARPLYGAVRPLATGLRNLEPLPLPSFLLATPPAGRAPAAGPP